MMLTSPSPRGSPAQLKRRTQRHLLKGVFAYRQDDPDKKAAKEIAARTLRAAASRSVSPSDLLSTIRWLEINTRPCERDITPDVLNGQWRLQLTSSHTRKQGKASWWNFGDAVLSFNDQPEDDGSPPTFHIRNSAYAFGVLAVHFEGSSLWDQDMKVLDFVFRTCTLQLGRFRLPSLRLPPFGPAARAPSRSLLLGRPIGGGDAPKPSAPARLTPGFLVEAPSAVWGAEEKGGPGGGGGGISSSGQLQEQAPMLEDPWGDAVDSAAAEETGDAAPSSSLRQDNEEAEEVLRFRDGPEWSEPSLSEQPAAEDRQAESAAGDQQQWEEKEEVEEAPEPPWHDGPYSSAIAHTPVRDPPLGDAAQQALRALEEEEQQLLKALQLAKQDAAASSVEDEQTPQPTPADKGAAAAAGDAQQPQEEEEGGDGDDGGFPPAEDEPSLMAVSATTSGAGGTKGIIALAGVAKSRRSGNRRPSTPIAAVPSSASQQASGDGSGSGGGIPLHRRGRKMGSLFRIIFADEHVLVARGREGGVALWTRHSSVPAYRIGS